MARTPEPKRRGLEAVQVDMDPVRLAATCMALSLQNALLREEVRRLQTALSKPQTQP